MNISADWKPIRWPAGPLELERRAKGDVPAEAREASRRWENPESLALLRGTPFNCLVVAWAAGSPQDAAHQRALAPLIAQAKARGLAVVGLIEPAADAKAAAGLAVQAGLSLLPYADREKLPWNSASPILLARDNVWPGILRRNRDGTPASATGGPWIDSNGWFLQLARARARSKTLWLLADPPEKTVLRSESYTRALADIHQRGGRWVVSLDDHLRAGLVSGDAAAAETLRTIGAGVEFFDRHRAWRTYEPLGAIGVISDFEGPNDFLGSEILNLLARRNLPFRVVLKSAAETGSFEGFHALVHLDEQPASAALRTRLNAFVSAGGLLITGRKWSQAGAPTARQHPRFEVQAIGKGQVAISREESPDPYQVALDCHILLGRAHDTVRFFNISSMISSYTGAGPHAVMEMVNYAMRVPGDLVTLWFREPYRSARLWTIGAGNSEPLTMAAENGGVEVRLPSISTYAAVELSKV